MWLSVPQPSPVLPMPETSRSFPLVLCYLQYQLSCPSQEGNRKVIKNSTDYHLFTLLARLSQRQNTLNHLGSFPFLLFLNIIKLCSFFFLNLVGCKSLKKMLLNYWPKPYGVTVTSQWTLRVGWGAESNSQHREQCNQSLSQGLAFYKECILPHKVIALNSSLISLKFYPLPWDQGNLLYV